MNSAIVNVDTIIELLRFTDTQQRHAAELAKATGEGFNIFHILRIGHREVTTHSPILGDLLNPRGRHDQGSVFLELFIKQFLIEDFEPETATVALEHYAGPIDEESGGRIDILIKDEHGKCLVIENKIYACDQPNQITRYGASMPDAHLFYLTRDGREPADAENVAHLKCISYGEDVLAWLKECRKEATCVPTVRETLSQYIHLVQDLTHQNTDARMDNEITRAVLQNGSTYDAYLALCNAKGAIDESILSKLKGELEHFSASCGLKLAFSSPSLSTKYAKLLFTSIEMDKQSIRIEFAFNYSGRRGCVFGFCRAAEGCACPVERQLFDAFKNRFPEARQSPAWWVALSDWKAYSNWDERVMAEIQFGSFHVEIEKIVGSMLVAFESATGQSPR